MVSWGTLSNWIFSTPYQSFRSQHEKACFCSFIHTFIVNLSCSKQDHRRDLFRNTSTTVIDRAWGTKGKVCLKSSLRSIVFYQKFHHCIYQLAEEHAWNHWGFIFSSWNFPKECFFTKLLNPLVLWKGNSCSLLIMY